METQNEIKTNEEELDVQIGAEMPPLEAKPVVVQELRIESIHPEVKDSARKVVLKCVHPDIQDNIEISSVKYEKGKVLKESGLWYRLDKDNKLPFGSALAYLLRFNNVNRIVALKGVTLQTAIDSKGYLTIKAY